MNAVVFQSPHKPATAKFRKIGKAEILQRRPRSSFLLKFARYLLKYIKCINEIFEKSFARINQRFSESS
jgi:hypothetical protein